MKIILLLLAFCLAGCSYTRPIGMVGCKRFSKVQLGSFIAPGQTLIVVEDLCTHEITVLSPMGGNGLIPGVLQAGGIAGGAVILGQALKKDDPQVIEQPEPEPPVKDDCDLPLQRHFKHVIDPNRPPFSGHEYEHSRTNINIPGVLRSTTLGK